METRTSRKRSDGAKPYLGLWHELQDRALMLGLIGRLIFSLPHVLAETFRQLRSLATDSMVNRLKRLSATTIIRR